MIGSTEIVNTSYDRDSLTITGDMNEGTLPINNEDDILNNAGIASTDTIATLNGAALTALNTATMRLMVIRS